MSKFSIRRLNKNSINNILNHLSESHNKFYKNRRDESYSNYINEISDGKKSILKNYKTKSKSGKKLKTLTESYSDRFWRELDEELKKINDELEVF
tara:strand:- start:123 stop:407 length:285 start_codon:yes stop_codon:yes gene_type:complete